MSTKVSIDLDDDVAADLDSLVTAGMRSQVVNRALRREILAIRRQEANQRMEAARQSTTPVSTAALGAQLRRDRGRG